MFYWIYDVPALWVIVLFEAAFVGVCWLGTLFLRPSARSWLGQEPRLNDMLAAFLQYFGVIYGLLLGSACRGDLPKPLGCRKEQRQ